MMSTLKIDVLAFRIWAHCKPLDWNLTIRECSEQMGITLGSTLNTVRAKGWVSRFAHEVPISINDSWHNARSPNVLTTNDVERLMR
tara:strand:- start:245 stop:502 length:258 start_codon:yes stop_codon:yes gene_type:complete